MTITRNRLCQTLALVVVVLAGLGSRSAWAGTHLPSFVVTYAGDALWALMVFLGLGLLLPRTRTSVVAALAFVIAFGVEASQLYQGGWLNRIRATRLGALTLGSGFLWSDLLCYSVGILAGVVGERLAGRLREGSSPQPAR